MLRIALFVCVLKSENIMEENEYAAAAQESKNTGCAVKLTFIIRNSSTILYMSSQPLFSNLQHTFNALTGANKLNQSSPNIIDC